MTDYKLCKNCKFFGKYMGMDGRLFDNNPINYYCYDNPGFNSCARFIYGYHTMPGDADKNEIIIEDDEGWGAQVGPEFGCVLFEKKDNIK